MLPRWHILLGALFTLLIWFFAPTLNLIYLALIFFSSFLIDFDHYVNAAMKQKKLSLFQAFDYHREMLKQEESERKREIRKKGDFQVFHTVEFHILVALIGAIWIPFFYIFIGMIFHSLLDLIYLLYTGRFYVREYFIFNWLRRR